MPIRLNLLAEAQALEELRRRDPVKRGIWGAALLVAAMLIYSCSLWAKSLLQKSELAVVENKIKAHSTEYDKIVQEQKTVAKAKQNLSALTQLTINRFLNGSLLDALQHTTVENVQLIRLQMSQAFPFTPEAPATTNSGRITPAKPARATEKKTLTLVGKAFGQEPTASISKYKEAIGNYAYFQNMLGKTNEIRLKDLSMPQQDVSGKSFVIFTLECRFPDKTR